MAFIMKNGKWVIDRTKPFIETAIYRRLKSIAENAGLSVEHDSELITLTSKDGIKFNDQCDYDVINHTEDRASVIGAFRDVITHYKDYKKWISAKSL